MKRATTQARRSFRGIRRLLRTETAAITEVLQIGRGANSIDCEKRSESAHFCPLQRSAGLAQIFHGSVVFSECAVIRMASVSIVRWPVRPDTVIGCMLSSYRHALARAAARAAPIAFSARAASVASTPIVRDSVGSEATGPNTTAAARRSAHRPNSPHQIASETARSVITFAGSWIAIGFRQGGRCQRQLCQSPDREGSDEHPRACSVPRSHLLGRCQGAMHVSSAKRPPAGRQGQSVSSWRLRRSPTGSTPADPDRGRPAHHGRAIVMIP